MVDTYYIPQKTTAPVVESENTPVPQKMNPTAIQQAVKEAVRAAVPNIYATGRFPEIHITVNIHL